MAIDLFCESAIAFSKGSSADAIAVRKAQDASRSLLLYRQNLEKVKHEILRSYNSNRPTREADRRQAQDRFTEITRQSNRAIALIEEGEAALERNGVSDWSERLQRLQDLRVSR